ncbi:DUF5996 family protein [Gillisia hiemivivida]|uniref:DUF5996 family protein n=1 Tax=Gillisia hiemivivida TaxID=291190 RepID=UPI0021CEAA8B
MATFVTSKGENRSFSLKNMSVVNCWKNVAEFLKEFGIEEKMNRTPNKMVDPIPFDKDEKHNESHSVHASNWYTVLLNVDEVFNPSLRV